MAEGKPGIEHTQAMVVLEQKTQEIALIKDVAEVKDGRDKAEALRVYARSAGKSLEVQNECAEMRLRYERRAGELLIDYEMWGGWKADSPEKPKLSDLAITKDQSSRWQRIAQIPETMFEAFLEEAKARVREITTAGALKVYRLADAERRKAEIMEGDVGPLLSCQGVLLQGDMREILLTEPHRDIADLILTDPPFGLGETAEIEFAGRGNMSRSAGDWDNFDKVEASVIFAIWAGTFRRIIKPDGSLYCFVADMYLGNMVAALGRAGFLIREILVWKKTNPPPSVRKRNRRSDVEYIIYATAGEDFTLNWTGQERMVKGLLFPICGGNERLDHPTQKPIALLKEYIEVSTNEGDLVVDPFAGVGSTGVAARDLGRRYLLIERDDYYFRQARIRLQ